LVAAPVDFLLAQAMAAAGSGVWVNLLHAACMCYEDFFWEDLTNTLLPTASSAFCF